ncbi:MAG: hypothetical protein JNL01_13745 [Bdellovibrionales bacterium]|nr:hypothetical protein [Bdellovibrionales bacterium]
MKKLTWVVWVLVAGVVGSLTMAIVTAVREKSSSSAESTKIALPATISNP